MNFTRSIATRRGSVPGNRLRIQARAVPLFPAMPLPHTQAGRCPGNGTRLCPFPKGAWNEMNSNCFNQIFEHADDDEIPNYRVDDTTARSRIGAGARAVNRLLWSFLLLLLPLIWNFSDWIGLLILSQAFFIAAKLIQPNVAKANSSASPAHAALAIQEGDDCAQG